MPISTKFNKVNYEPAGDSFVLSSGAVSSQYSKNLIAVPAFNTSASPATLMSMPGLKLWSAGTAEERDRGIYEYLFSGNAWKVSGSKLYSFGLDGNQLSIGAVLGANDVKISASSSIMMIVSPEYGAYTTDGLTVSPLTLSDTPVDLTYINNQFVVLYDTGVVGVSGVGNTTFSSTNTFQAESVPDDMVGVYAYNQFLFLFGEKSIEPWENVGVGDPPFERMNGAIIEDVGLANRDAITKTEKAMYILGHNKIPYSIANFQARNIAEENPGISELFNGYDKSKCFLSSFVAYGQNVIAYHFPDAKKVWCYPEVSGLWFEVDHDKDGQFWLGKSSVNLFSKVLVGDRQNGNIYELDEATYQNNSTIMTRERVFRPLSGESLGSPRDYFQMKCIQFNVETGVGVDDDDPQMAVSYSTDGARSYSNERWLSLGQDGQYQYLVEDYTTKKFKDLVVKVRYTENTRFTLGSAGIYIRVSGK